MGLDTRQTCLHYSGMGRTRAITSAARQRILETADRLFYEEGIRAVGIDRIIAEASVAKMTLYTHFVQGRPDPGHPETPRAGRD
jgi:hypothetical protein